MKKQTGSQKYSYLMGGITTSQWDLQFKEQISFDFFDTKRTYMNLCNHKIPSILQLGQLLVDASNILQKRENIVNIISPETITITGDLHGSFEFLHRLFDNYLLHFLDPGSELILFNGDFCDRGFSGVQVLTLICSLLLKYPSRVFLNRGNHESSEWGACTNNPQNVDGFMHEIQHKYQLKPEGLKEFQVQLLWFYASIPIAHIVNHHTLVTHAGVPDGSSNQVMLYGNHADKICGEIGCQHYNIQSLQTIDRSKFSSLQANPPDDQLWQSFMWSYSRNAHDAGFLKCNGFKNAIFSHSACPYCNVYVFQARDGKFEQKFLIKDDEVKEAVANKYSDDWVTINEVFSSPTTSGGQYIIQINGDEPNPFKWNIVKVSVMKDYIGEKRTQKGRFERISDEQIAEYIQ